MDGTVRVAAIYSVGLHDMSRHMQPLHVGAIPQARVLLECLHPHKVVEAVLNDEADLGILSYPGGDARARGAAPARRSPWCSSPTRRHRLARRRSVTPGDLQGRSSWPSTATWPIRKAIDRALRQHNVKVEVVMEFDNVETIKQAIGINAGRQHPAAAHRAEGARHAHAGRGARRPPRARAPHRRSSIAAEAPDARGGALHRAAPEARRRLSRLTRARGAESRP